MPNETEIGQLSRLQALLLDSNQLAVIPYLPKLRSLKIDDNPLKKIL
ncbi:hypothetical protein NEOC65_000327 [Neochlamydia sp. AcF65]|nr:hypothetical protein [Neochlamydia sp. AcF65]MBS4165274.1 hypothetical protein [Neochlamydia sp. AcF65]